MKYKIVCMYYIVSQWSRVLPLAATIGWAVAKGNGLGVAAKIGATVVGGMAGLVAKKVPVISEDDLGGTIVQVSNCGVSFFAQTKISIDFIALPLLE